VLRIQVQKLIEIHESKGSRGPSSSKARRALPSSPRRHWATIPSPTTSSVDSRSSPAPSENPFVVASSNSGRVLVPSSESRSGCPFRCDDCPFFRPKPATRPARLPESTPDVEVIENNLPVVVVKLYKAPGVVVEQAFVGRSITKTQLQRRFHQKKFIWRKFPPLWTGVHQDSITVPGHVLYLAVAGANHDAIETWYQFEENAIYVSD
jgi:hypothetical protein